MTTSNFKFLDTEYPELARFGKLAERYIYDDPTKFLASKTTENEI